jgi:tetratricopeptide (TPR) repeat protein
MSYLADGLIRREVNLVIQVVGPLCVRGRGGLDYTPKGRKACALLALLALAPDYRRPRAWLQDKLWSDRGQKQGSDSLRQTLAEIRRAFGAERGGVQSDRTMIWLDGSRVAVENTTAGKPNPEWQDERALLEGLEVIRDPEFENWLRDQRTRFETGLEKDELQIVGISAVDETASATGPARLQLVLQRPSEVQSEKDMMLAHGLADTIAKTLSEIGTVDVVDLRRDQNQPPQLTRRCMGLSLQAGVVHGPEGASWRIQLSDPRDGGLVWATSARQDNVNALNMDEPELLRQLNLVVDVVITRLLARFSEHDPGRMATALCHQGIQHLIRLGRKNFLLADQFFQHAFELEPRGIYLAWRAYVRTFLLVERHFSCRQTLTEETLDFIRRALEREPHNSYVASFAAHVQSVMSRSYVAAYEFAQRSIQLNKANPLGWACLGIAECYLGQTKAGYRHTVMAREISGTGPFRFQVDAWSCIAASILGDFERAIWFGEASHALAPNYAPPLRYLSALYLSHNQEERSQEALQKMQAIEPDFSYDRLRDKSYPSAGLHRSGLLERLPGRQV